MMRFVLVWFLTCASALAGNVYSVESVALDGWRDTFAKRSPLWEVPLALRGVLGVQLGRKLSCDYYGFESSPEYQNFSQCVDEKRQTVDMSIVGADLRTLFYCWCTLDMATLLNNYGCSDADEWSLLENLICQPNCDAPEMQSCYQDCPAICFEPDYRTTSCNCDSRECITNAICLIQRAENDTAAGLLEHICDDAKAESSEAVAAYKVCFTQVTHRTAWDRLVARQFCLCQTNASEMLSRYHCCGSQDYSSICAETCPDSGLCSAPEASSCIYDCRALCYSLTSNLVTVECWNRCVVGSCSNYTACPPLPQVFQYLCDDGGVPQDDGCCSGGQCPGSCGLGSTTYKFRNGLPSQCACVGCASSQGTTALPEAYTTTTPSGASLGNYYHNYNTTTPANNTTNITLVAAITTASNAAITTTSDGAQIMGISTTSTTQVTTFGSPTTSTGQINYHNYSYGTNSTNATTNTSSKGLIVLSGSISLNANDPVAFSESTFAQEGVVAAIAETSQVDTSMVNVNLTLTEQRRLSARQRHLVPSVLVSYNVSLPANLRLAAENAYALLSDWSGPNAAAKLDILASQIRTFVAEKAQAAGAEDPAFTVHISSASIVEEVWTQVSAIITTTTFPVINVSDDDFLEPDPNYNSNKTVLMPLVADMNQAYTGFGSGSTRMSIPQFISSVFPDLGPVLENALPGVGDISINTPQNVSIGRWIGIGVGAVAPLLLCITSSIAFYVCWRRKMERAQMRQQSDGNVVDANVGQVVGRAIVVDAANNTFSDKKSHGHGAASASFTSSADHSSSVADAEDAVSTAAPEVHSSDLAMSATSDHERSTMMSSERAAFVV